MEGLSQNAGERRLLENRGQRKDNRQQTTDEGVQNPGSESVVGHVCALLSVQFGDGLPNMNCLRIQKQNALGDRVPPAMGAL
jgi:hypothetical protein